jgi:AcrR family transcriptional regulator
LDILVQFVKDPYLEIMTTTEETRPAPRGNAAKQACILDAAAEVFCREGVSAASVDLIAAEAGVSRQTIYNHHQDKKALFIAVVKEITERSNADVFTTLASFPDEPSDIEADLVGFARRLASNCLCNSDGRMLRRLIETEGQRFPEVFAAWRENGPDKLNTALASLFGRLAHAGVLDIDDPSVAARHFIALVQADTRLPLAFGGKVGEEEIDAAVRSAVGTFLRAFRRREPAVSARPQAQLTKVS